MYRVVCALTAALFIFILWIIYLADRGDSPLFFYLVQQWPYGDKACHFLLYGLLALLLNLTLELKVLTVARIRVYAGTLAVALFAVIEELSQALFPNRTLDAMDLAADAAGILLFSLLSFGIDWCRQRRLDACQ
ncbi:VanZ family protein [Marinobacter mobilis]|uniref:VanZ like family protein n=1 Tax=Marinobacter mobilis TaxID=488533 RepID=A0A1H3C526_9GAMM|nr:VanZ family protein [Marinobacter mobilis]SDX01786.1 VanZ like family protein [Marinobacter mobilis]SDX49282.1 VanZ like family protein [Marinobacter mobilis]